MERKGGKKGERGEESIEEIKGRDHTLPFHHEDNMQAYGDRLICVDCTSHTCALSECIHVHVHVYTVLKKQTPLNKKIPTCMYIVRT